MGDVYMVNGKILSGLPNNAKDIKFDNTGTTLNSTNTEDAIKEVNSNLAGQYVEVLADGSKTYKQLFDELWALIDKTKITRHSVLMAIGSTTTRLFETSSYGISGLYATVTWGETSGVISLCAGLSGNSSYAQLNVSGGSVSITNVSSGVSTYSFRFYYN